MGWGEKHGPGEVGGVKSPGEGSEVVVGLLADLGVAESAIAAGLELVDAWLSLAGGRELWGQQDVIDRLLDLRMLLDLS